MEGIRILLRGSCISDVKHCTSRVSQMLYYIMEDQNLLSEIMLIQILQTTLKKITSGYIFIIASGAVRWVSKLQVIVALSTTETKYMATIQACKEAYG